LDERLIETIHQSTDFFTLTVSISKKTANPKQNKKKTARMLPEVAIKS
jgi:hypothetical protein